MKTIERMFSAEATLIDKFIVCLLIPFLLMFVIKVFDICFTAMFGVTIDVFFLAFLISVLSLFMVFAYIITINSL